MNWPDVIKQIACGICDSTISEKIKPTSREIVTCGGLRQILRTRFPEGEIYLSDSTYLLCSVADISKFLQQDGTNKCKYQTEAYDCDNFSYRLMGQFSVPDWGQLAFGIVWSNFHALNLFVDEQRKVWFVEPQNDNILEDLEPWMGTTIRFIVM